MKQNNGRDSRKHFRLLGLGGACIALGMLSGCGGDSLGNTTGGGEEGSVSTGGVKAGPVHSLTISYPVLDAIEDQSNGVYRRKLSVLLRDQQGIPLPDGTVVNLRVIDSILATGTIATGSSDSISGNTLNIPSAAQTDGTALPDLTTATVSRVGTVGGQNRGISAGDTVLLFNAPNNLDVMRQLSSTPTLANTLNVSQAYTRSYPDTNEVSYMVGASMLSAGIVGEDSEGNLVAGRVTVQGGDGTATAWISYAANVGTLRTGCLPGIDSRVSPLGSGQVYVVASSGDVTTFKDFCFNSIAGFTVTPSFSELGVSLGGSANVRVCTEDGGNQVPVPLFGISAGKTEGDLTADLTIFGLRDPTTEEERYLTVTDLSGCFVASFSNIQGGSAASGTWSFSVGDGSTDVTLTLPEFEEAAPTP